MKSREFVDELNKKAFDHRHDNPENSLEWAKKAQAIALEINYVLGSAISDLQIGFYYLNKGDNQIAHTKFMHALYIFKDENDHFGIAEAQYNLGLLNFRLGNLDLAYAQFNDSLHLHKKIKCKVSIGRCYYQIASVRLQLKLWRHAERSALKSLKSELDADSISGISAVQTLLGRIYIEQGKFELAEELLKESLKHRIYLNERISIASTLFYLIELGIKKGDYNQAERFLNEHKQIFDSIDFPYGRAQTELVIAKVHIHKGNKEKANFHLLRSIDIANEFNLKEQLSNSYLLISELYEQEGQLKESLKYFKLYHETINETIKNQSKKLLDNVNLTNEIHNARKKAEYLKTLNTELVSANNKVSDMNENLTSSIKYAKRIQEAVFPTGHEINEIFPNHYYIQRPKDIVSGDFLWMKQQLGTIFVAVADCTGHGVPGAMLSMYSNNILNNAQWKINTQPADILDHIRTNFIADLITETEAIKDGMDIALVKLQGRNLTFAGAYRSLFILREGEIIEIKGDRQPVGLYLKMNPFTNESIQLMPGDQIVMFTDGITDQLGGERDKKLKISGFRAWLTEIAKKPMELQHGILNDKISGWKGSNEQTDDMLLFSFRVQ